MKTPDKEMSDMSNIGWLYYYDYFRNIDFEKMFDSKEEINIELFKKRVKDTDQIGKNNICIQKAATIKNNNLPYYDMEGLSMTIDMKVAYPGLVTGIGFVHEMGIEGEYKLGLHFDYASGLPVIHGSSVKGLLRSVFPSLEKDPELRSQKEGIIKKWLQDLEVEAKVDIPDFEKQIFDGIANGKQMSVYDRDIFFGAVVIQANKANKILDSDSITPHKDNPLKNPVPLTFLKIASGVEMRFTFDLKAYKVGDNEVVSAEKKKLLFQKILEYFGAGAKTNVGYGKLSFAGK